MLDTIIGCAFLILMCVVGGAGCAFLLKTPLKCSYYKIGKEQVGDEKLWKINITEPCNKPAIRIYNGIAICEKHFQERIKDDKEAMRQQIRDTKEITDFKIHKLEEDIQKEYTKKNVNSWKEATWNILADYGKRYGFFWAEPLSVHLIGEAIKKDAAKG